MKRRTLLGLAATTSVSATGCLGGGSLSPTPSVVVTDERFGVLGVDCGTEVDSARVTHEATGTRTGRVTVEGSLGGNDTCYRARLAAVGVEGGTLHVGVESYQPATDSDVACAECIVSITYRAVLTYEGRMPASVRVRHDENDVSTTDLS